MNEKISSFHLISFLSFMVVLSTCQALRNVVEKTNYIQESWDQNNNHISKRAAVRHCRTKPVGCFKEDETHKVLRKLLFTHVELCSPEYAGTEVDLANYPQFFTKLFHNCKYKARIGKYRYFGLSNYGECWAGIKVHKGLGKLRSVCVNKDLKCCRKVDKYCAGKESGIFVFEFAKTIARSPTTTIQAQGCYKDSRSKRVLKNLIRTYRDKSSSVYAKKSIEWKNYPTFLRQMIGICQKIARGKGYKYLGIEYYGECWAGNEPAYLGGPVPSRCVNDQFKECKSGTKYCSGKDLALYVYKLL